MANLGNGAKTANGQPSSLTLKSSPASKRAKLSATQERAVLVVLSRLFPQISSVTLSELSRIYGADFIRAINSVDSINGLKRYIHDHCKNWLKQHTEGFIGHVPASWGRIPLTASGKFTRADKSTKPSKPK